MNWNEVQSAFDLDGSLRDIYVLNATIDDWQRLLDCLHESSYSMQFERNHVEQPIPKCVEGIFSGGSEKSSLLSIDVGGVVLNCHFFSHEEIEFDLNPREVDTAERGSAAIP